MRSGVVIKKADCVVSVAVPTFHEPLKELEIAACIHCFIISGIDSSKCV